MINDSYNDNLHKGATGKLYEYGKDLRQTSTKAEDVLWQHLRNKKLDGLKFRRQHPLDNFIADFYCNEKKLVIELDGSVHDEKEIQQYDKARTNDLKELGVLVIRFRNEEIIKNIDKVLEKISEIAIRR